MFLPYYVPFYPIYTYSVPSYWLGIYGVVVWRRRERERDNNIIVIQKIERNMGDVYMILIFTSFAF
jgi:hypothetical protein